MTPVALGIPLDHARPRYRIFPCDRGQTTRALMEVHRRLMRSHGTLHRRVFRAREIRRITKC